MINVVGIIVGFLAGTFVTLVAFVLGIVSERTKQEGKNEHLDR